MQCSWLDWLLLWLLLGLCTCGECRLVKLSGLSMAFTHTGLNLGRLLWDALHLRLVLLTKGSKQQQPTRASAPVVCISSSAVDWLAEANSARPSIWGRMASSWA